MPQTEPYPPIAKKIATAREIAGLSEADMANRMGCSLASYADLESYNDELFMSVSLAEIRLLCELIKTPFAQLIGFDVPQPRVTLDEVVEAVKLVLEETGESPEEFSERVGWDVTTALSDRLRAFSDWNLDGLIEISAAVGIPWREVEF